MGLSALWLILAVGAGAGLGYSLRGSHTTAPPAHTEDKRALSDLVWLEVLAPGTQSPRGQTAASITADQALTLADTKLHGLDGPPDPEEARFWLRVGVRKIMDNERLQWALTQLGTLYAQPGSPASSLLTARSLWDLAAANSDPLALCFLAALDEKEMVTAADKARALMLYQRAKEAGDCVAADQAIDRLSR